MTLKNTNWQFQDDPSFPQQVDLNNILPFINPIPNLNFLTKSPTSNFENVFENSKQIILQKKKQTQEFITEISHMIKCAEDFSKNITKNDFQIKIKKNVMLPDKIAHIRKLTILNQKYISVLQKYKKAILFFQMKTEHCISDFLLVCEWFISNPRPFYINIETALPNVSY